MHVHRMGLTIHYVLPPDHRIDAPIFQRPDFERLETEPLDRGRPALNKGNVTLGRARFSASPVTLLHWPDCGPRSTTRDSLPG